MKSALLVVAFAASIVLGCSSGGSTGGKDGGAGDGDATDAWQDRQVADGQVADGQLDAPGVDGAVDAVNQDGAGLDGAAGRDAGVSADGAAGADAGPWGQPFLGCGATSSDLADSVAGSTLLIDVGHTGAFSSLFQSGDRVLAADKGSGRWILWDTPTGGPMAHGSGTIVGAGGSMFATKGATLECHTLADGHLLSTIPVGSNVQLGLASDGSYLWGASSTAIGAWSSAGTPLLSHAGNYAAAAIFGAPSELRIARGPAGSSVIEHLAVPSGAATVGPAFSGTFSSWFLDGGRFLTTLNTTVWVYAQDGSQIEIATPPTVSGLTGEGDFFWSFGSNSSPYPIYVYAVSAGGGASPTAQFSESVNAAVIPLPAANMIGVLPYGTASVDLIHLGGQITRTQVSVPSAYNKILTADGAGRLTVGNDLGVLSFFDTTADPSASGFLGCGQVTALAGSAANVAAVGTASGKIVVLDAASAVATQAVRSFASAHVALTDDGTVLAATDGAYGAQYLPEFDFNIYDLTTTSMIGGISVPSTIGSWSSSLAPWTWDFRIARNGRRVGRVEGDPRSSTRHVSDLSGTVHVIDDTGASPAPRLSPSGSYIAMSDVERLPASTTRIYHDSTLVTAVPGFGVAWLDDQRLLVQSYTNVPGGDPRYDHSTLYDNQGAVVGTPSGLPEIADLDVVSASQVLSRSDSKIYDVTTGALIWSAGLPAGAALVGPSVAYARAGGVFLVRH
jgi:hypothetical protein